MAVSLLGKNKNPPVDTKPDRAYAIYSNRPNVVRFPDTPDSFGQLRPGAVYGAGGSTEVKIPIKQTRKDGMQGRYSLMNQEIVGYKPGNLRLPESYRDYIEDYVINDPRYKEAQALGIFDEAKKRYGINFDNPYAVGSRFRGRGADRALQPKDIDERMRMLEGISKERQLRTSQEEQKKQLTQDIMEKERTVRRRTRNARSLLAQLPSATDDTLGTRQTLGA